MKFLVIDNGSQYLENILYRISENHSVEVLSYRPGVFINPNSDTDMVILSGGMVNEVLDKVGRQYYYQSQFDFIRNSNLPIFGICLGLQMMSVAMGGSLRRMPKLINTNKTIKLNHEGHELLDHGDFFVHTRHQWVANEEPQTGFRVLATSSEGIEIIHHKNRHLFATQFHPEIDTDYNSEKQFWRLVNKFAHKSAQKKLVMR